MSTQPDSSRPGQGGPAAGAAAANAAPPAASDAFRRLAWILGVAGLLPFFGHALFAWVAPPEEAGGLLRSQAHYAGAVLAFVGALHWGAALASPLPFTSRDGVRLAWSVIPALFCWVITLYPPSVAVPALFFGLLAAFAADLWLYAGSVVPRWFLALRAVLTAGAALCVGATWLAMATRLAQG